MSHLQITAHVEETAEVLLGGTIVEERTYEMSAAGRQDPRLTALEIRRNGASDEQLAAPLNATRLVYERGASLDDISVRLSFIRRSTALDGDIPEHGQERKKDMPPAGFLGKSGSRGLALRTALLLLFAAQQLPPGFTRTQRQFWPIPIEASTSTAVGLVDLVAPIVEQVTGSYRHTTKAQLRLRRVHTALNTMAGKAVSLVDLPNGKGYAQERFARPGLFMETGPRTHGRPLKYEAPSADEPVIKIPASFFLSGWLHLLTDSEILCWLMFRAELTVFGPKGQDGHGLQIPGTDRLAWYGLSKDIWDTHLMLDRLNLLNYTPDPHRRADGTMPEFTTEGRGARHIFAFNDEALTAENALDKTIAAVRDASANQ